MNPVAIQSCVIAPHLKEDLGRLTGKYGRMFPDVPPLVCTPDELITIGQAGAVMDAIQDDDDLASGDNPCIPAGWPIFGQFIAHNITADRSLLQLHANVGELRNFRSPSLNLESLYSAGPGGSPYLYDSNDIDTFLLGQTIEGTPDDVPRNSQGTALIGDPRNDVHVPIAQLHLAFLRFHNSIVAFLRKQGVAPQDVFSEAQRLTRWHYQWIVIHEYLPLITNPSLVQDILTAGPRFFDWSQGVYIPIEFADAAFRFGHSQIRFIYQLNSRKQGRIFPDLRSGRHLSADEVIDWRYFFNLDSTRPPQLSRRIDARLAHALMQLPEAIVGKVASPEQASLAYRDLVRGQALDLPSGETLARLLDVTPLTAEEVGLAQHGWQEETPLWFYVMREAATQTRGVALGEVGSRIVAEVLIGLIDADSTSYRANDPSWMPTLSAATPGDFTIADLLRFATSAQ